MANLSLWNLFLTVVLLFVVGAHLRRLVGNVRNGELHMLTSAGGDGLAGHVGRADQPLLFWLVLVAKATLLIGFLIFFFIEMVLS